MERPRIAACTLAAALVLGAVACAGDESGPASPSTPPPAADGSGPTTTSILPTAPSVGDGGTTAPGAPTTVSPNLAPTDSPLVDQLLDPAAVGQGYAPDDTLGGGTFDGDLCEDVTIEPSWVGQAGQGLSRSEGDGLTTFTQAVLAFEDAGAAGAFTAAVRDGQTTCLGAQAPDVAAGDEAFLVSVSDEEGSSAVAVVRVGARATVLTTLGPGDPGPVDEDLVRQAAVALGG